MLRALLYSLRCEAGARLQDEPYDKGAERRLKGFPLPTQLESAGIAAPRRGASQLAGAAQ